MFEKIIQDLESVKRFDIVTNSNQIEWGKVKDLHGRDQLALQAKGSAVVLNPHARAQAAGRFDIPRDHFERLPVHLQVAEMEHFGKQDPKEVTIRSFDGEGAIPTARAIMSGKYSPFDSAEVLKVAAPILSSSKYEVAKPSIGRDEMSLFAVMPQEYDVASRSSRAKGDIVKCGVAIRNSEIGTASLTVEFLTYRLVCTNGLVCPTAEVSVRQRHIFVSHRGFRAQLESAIRAAKEVGEEMIQLMRDSREIAMYNLDPDGGKIQSQVHGVLKRAGYGTQVFRKAAEAAIAQGGGSEEPSLFGLVQFVTGEFTRETKDLGEQMRRQKLGGQLLQLAA